MPKRPDTTALRLLLLVLCVAGLGPASAGTIALRWDAVSGAQGYRVCYGTQSSEYTVDLDVGNVTEYVVQDLEDCGKYFLAVKAYNHQGESEQFSNEVSGWPRPVIDTAQAVVTAQGDRFTLDIDGRNFEPGAQLLIHGNLPVDLTGNPLVRLEDVRVISCRQIQALVAVEPTAQGVRAMQVGDFSLGFEVRNPDRVFGENSVLFQVRFDPARADLNRSDASTRDRVDGQDLVWLAHAHGSLEGESRYNPDADLDGSGLVDGDDLALLASVFGGCWNGGGWSSEACR